MAKSIKKLLSKKGWTGDEVGKALIASLVNDIKTQGKEPLFSQEDFERMENSLTNNNDYIIYGVYHALYNSIVTSFNRGQGNNHMFFRGYLDLLIQLNAPMNADAVERDKASSPVIMTESQYNRLKENAKTIKAQELSEDKYSFCDIVLHCLSYFDYGDEASEKETRDKCPAIWEAIKATENIPATGNRYLPYYNAFHDEGYFQLPDGRRSDKMTSEEWREALDELYLKTHKYMKNGRLASLEETRHFFKLERLTKGYELYYKGSTAIRAEIGETLGIPEEELPYTDKELENALNTVIAGEICNSPAEKLVEKLFNEPALTEWHNYETPKDLSLYDILDMYYDFEDDQKKAFQNLKKDIPALYNAIKTYIESVMPQAGELKANQYYKELFSKKELAEAGIIGYDNSLVVTDSDILRYNFPNTNIITSRIAIIRDPSTLDIDNNGDYSPYSDRLIKERFNTLYTLAEDSNTLEWIIADKQLVEHALSFLYAYNALIEIISGVYDLPDLNTYARQDVAYLEYKVQAYNNLLYCFYYTVEGNQTEIEKKRSLIKEIFSPLEAEALKPSQDAIEEITDELVNLGYSSKAREKLKDLQPLIDRLANSGKGAL